jgi:hypothetical protein
MPRLYEIEVACRNAIEIQPNGRRILTIRRFLRSWSGITGTGRHGRQSVDRGYVTTFRDVSTQEGDDRTFQLFNPNGGL